MQPGPDLDRRVNSFVERVRGVVHVMMAGSDGLALAASRALHRDRADTAAAIIANVVALATRTANLLEGGKVAVTMVEAEGGYLFLMALGGGSCVLAWADRTCDVGQVGYELAVFAEQVGRAVVAP